jgi:hypothetical protein
MEFPKVLTGLAESHKFIIAVAVLFEDSCRST